MVIKRVVVESLQVNQRLEAVNRVEVRIILNVLQLKSFVATCSR